MTTLRAHFDGKQIVLDEPMPPGIPPNTPAVVTLQSISGTNGAANAHPTEPGIFDEIAALDLDTTGLPPDFAAQHDHYVKGLPKR